MLDSQKIPFQVIKLINYFGNLLNVPDKLFRCLNGNDSMSAVPA